MDDSELVGRYLRLRKMGREWNNELVRRLSRAAIQESGRRLGILQDGVLVFETEDETAVLTDYALYDFREDGGTVIDRYVAESTPCDDPDESDLLRAMSQARYSFFQVEAVVRDVGVHAQDLLRGESRVFIVDRGFSRSDAQGRVVAARLLPFDTFCMTSGAALPVDEWVLPEILAALSERFGSDEDDFDHLTCEEWSEMAALIVRECLAHGASASIRYVDAPSPGSSIKVGRKAPCPCGSGKKFKKCCGRAG